MTYDPTTDPQMNPGILETVKLLRSMDYNTTDSGDGQTHHCECDLPIPYVHIVVPEGEDMVEASRYLRDLIEMHAGAHIWDRSIPNPEEFGEPVNPTIQATYDPHTNTAIISMFGVCDADLFGYHVETSQEDGVWTAEVLELPGVAVTSRDPEHLPQLVKNVLSAYWNIPVAENDVQFVFVEKQK